MFHDIKEYLVKGEYTPLPLEDKFEILKRQIRESIDRIDPYRGILHIRRHLAASPLFKGIPNFRDTRIAMLRADTPEELMRIIDDTYHLLSTKQNITL